MLVSNKHCNTLREGISNDPVFPEDEDGSDDDDDFEEVAEKIDYEVSAEDDRLLEMVFLRSEQDQGHHPRPGPSKPRTNHEDNTVGWI